MYFFSFLLKNLFRRPARTMLTVLGLAVAVGAVVSLVGVSTGFKDSFMKLYQSRDVDLVVARPGNEALSGGLPEQLGEPIAKLKGVKEVQGGLVDALNFRKEGLELPVIVNGYDPKSSIFNDLKILSGRRLNQGDAHKIMIGRVLAANLGKQVGDKVELYADDFEIIGTYETGNVFENGGAVVLLSELQRLDNKPNEISGFTVSAVKPISEQELDDLAKRIQELQPGLKVEKSKDFVNNVQQIKMSGAVAWITSAIALIIGAIGMLNTMIMSVFERTKEIGTLRAIGWRRSRIIQMIIGESLILSIGGAIIGSAAGIGLVKLLTKLPVAAGMVSGNISTDVIVQGFLVAILVGAVGSIYPAIWGANLLPTEALRRK
jgi:putative ABC transport system permease protein